MAKQKKRPRRRNPNRMQSAERTQFCVGFCLPDTPGNRKMVEMLTGTTADAFTNGAGMLKGETGQKNSGDCEAGKLQSPLV